jgi:hypothetical protein
MHVEFGKYHVNDVQFVAAFDVDGKKVGVDLADAILASENNTIKIADVPPTGVTVQRGHTLDGLGKYSSRPSSSPRKSRWTLFRPSRTPTLTSWSATCPLDRRKPRSSTPRQPSTPG